MGDYARRKTTRPAQSIAPDNSRSKKSLPRQVRVPRSNFIEKLAKAREAEHRSVSNLAKMAGVTSSLSGS